MDRIDKSILTHLQRDSSMTLADLAEAVGLSPTPCWRRVQRLEETGVIKQRVCLLDGPAIGCGVTVLVSVRTNQHNPNWLDKFAKGVSEIDEILEVYRLSGDIDYILKIAIPDIAHYDAVYKRLIAVADFSDVSTSFVMETIKQTTALPLDYMHAVAKTV